MSTRVHYAWRAGLKDFPRALDFLRDRMWGQVLKLARTCEPPDIKSFIDLFGGAGFHVFVDQEHVYFIAYGLPGIVKHLGKQPFPRWLKDYAYWDNSDLPVGMTRARWKERGDTWDRLAFDGGRWDTKRLTLEVLGLHSGCIWELTEFFRKAKKKNP